MTDGNQMSLDKEKGPCYSSNHLTVVTKAQFRSTKLRVGFLKNTQSLFVEYVVSWLSHSEKVTDLNDNGPLWCASIELCFSTVPSTFIEGNSQWNCTFTLKVALFTTLRYIIFLKEAKRWIFSFRFNPKIVCFSWPIH